MPTPVETVNAFFAAWSGGIEAMERSIREQLSADCVYENIGLTRTVGPEAAVALLRMFEPMKKAQRMDVEIVATAAQGDTVLNERIDRVVGHQGELIFTVRVMGALEVRDGKIVAWRDYFDTIPFASPAAG
jgi:limonene-1,2-epoxide hydrolase